MLHSLHIRDLALIDDAEVRFDDGLNVVSGETGGGKSLLVAALKLLCGGKAAASLVRHGADELRVDGEFAIGTGDRSKAIAERVRELVGVELGDEMLVVTRIVDKNGRSKARVAGRPATLAGLRELCSWLVEIHGQGESRALMRPEIQAETLDAFAGTGKLRGEFAAALADARAVRGRIEAVQGESRDRLQRVEFLRYQLGELEVLGIEAGETARLEDEHKILANLDRVRADLQEALEAMLDGEPSAGDLVSRARRAVQDAAEIDSELDATAETCAEIEIQIDEACRVLQSRLGALDLDAGRLAEVEERLAGIRSALKRFGPTEADLLAHVASIRDELSELDADEEGGEALARELADRTAEVVRIGKRLVRARGKISGPFSKAIAAELGALGMPDAGLDVDMADAFDAAEILETATPHGPIPVEFMVRLNPGVPAQSLRETASGGETARIVLAIKKCLADQDRVPFLVFDEIDAEIGGRLGLAVGSKLADVAAEHQVLIVTHLPQVAAFGAAHFKVSKAVEGGTTHTRIARLDPGQSELELAAMAAGEGADAKAVEEARRLVARARGEQAS